MQFIKIQSTAKICLDMYMDTSVEHIVAKKCHIYIYKASKQTNYISVSYFFIKKNTLQLTVLKNKAKQTKNTVCFSPSDGLVVYVRWASQPT